MKISDNHTNQVYCRCSLCAENGYGGAWVSRYTRSRHMKIGCANRGTSLENDQVIYDLDNSFENSSDELFSSLSSLLKFQVAQVQWLIFHRRFLKVKIKHNLTDEAFQETMMVFNSNPISLHTFKKQLKSIVHIELVWTDMCLNSCCCAYTENYRKLTKCPVCGSELFQHKKPCKQYSYFSLIKHLTIQYRNYDRA
ncbi:hypothetical protein RclHR1_03100014 [Rhizophagus clarus]|uniref:Uncharacterized protein n=1 Tax=Rhizophagus clarus TaxID=94130 RepID=A0A2Z6RA76_9GLOM|nr:hypothetical protein RclHR1_03100014 [Rhizophagus clarus]GES93915.1 hypothetical protein GLOIN_2v1430842 [Rhizophagus clarus]